jgi:hypothetical protein
MSFYRQDSYVLFYWSFLDALSNLPVEAIEIKQESQEIRNIKIGKTVLIVSSLFLTIFFQHLPFRIFY